MPAMGRARAAMRATNTIAAVTDTPRMGSFTPRHLQSTSRHPSGNVSCGGRYVRVRAALFCLAVAACATEPPLAQMSAARSTVGQAQALASRYAPSELRTAQQKLDRADLAYRDKDYTA